MKKIIIPILVLGAIAWIAFTLADNKKETAKAAKLAEEVSTAIPVETQTVKQEIVTGNIRIMGNFKAFSDLSMLSQTEGLVTKVYAVKGAFVKKGTLLAEVENDVLKTEVEALKINFEKSEADLARFEELAKSNAVTGRDLEDITIASANVNTQYKNAQKRLLNTYIRATADGFINEDYIQEGSNIARNTKLYDLVDISKLTLSVMLTANEVLNVEKGQTVEVRSDLYPSEKYTAKVTAIAAKANNNLKYEVELLLPNSQQKPLKAGMFGTASFEFSDSVKKLLINRDALVGSVKEATVFVVQGSTVKQRKLVIGQLLGDKVEVLSGLKVGDQIVINGQINLQEGTTVKVIEATQS